MDDIRPSDGLLCQCCDHSLPVKQYEQKGEASETPKPRSLAQTSRPSRFRRPILRMAVNAGMYVFLNLLEEIV